MPRSKAQKRAKRATRVRKRELREHPTGVSPPPDYWIKDPVFRRLAQEAIAKVSLNPQSTTMARSNAQKRAKSASRLRKWELAITGVHPPFDYWRKDPSWRLLAQEAIAKISLNPQTRKD